MFSHPALQTNPGGPVPLHSQRKLEHPKPEQRSVDVLTQDRLMREDIELGLRIGNLIWSAVYGR